jgi:S1-C subfamily serine protease
MEQITKQQVILIALLVAIITAISTSVATVSLLDNPSGNSNQTIYKVIEKSIETVANIPTVKDISTAVKAPSTPSQISPSDIASAGVKSIVRIYDKSGADRKFVALGIAIGSKGSVLASTPAVDNGEGSKYIAVTSDGKEIPATLTKEGLPSKFVLFTLNYDLAEKNKVPAIDIKSSSAQKLGSNVVALGGKESGNVVSTGIIAEFAPQGGAAATSTDMMTTDMALSSNLSGWLLFDTSGNLIGFETDVDADKVAHFINGAVIKAAVSASL